MEAHRVVSVARANVVTVPNLEEEHGLVRAGRGKEPPVCRVCEGIDLVVMRLEDVHEFPFVRGPE